jgi:uncharacterized membrane protein YheB (UPF0754 family)
VHHLISGVNDRNEKVRISAIQVIFSQNLKIPKIRQELLTIMQNKDRTAYERILSYQHLQQTILRGEEYEAVYNFTKQALEKLAKQARQQVAQNHRQSGPVYYEF